MKKILEFTDLITWKKGHELVLEVYKITKNLPESEKFGICSQANRAAVSITSNIAEGFGRKGNKEKIQFYYIAHGSLTELHNQMLIIRDLGYIDESTFSTIADKLLTTKKLLLGLIKSIPA